MAFDPTSGQDPDGLLDKARERLKAPPPKERHWIALAAAAFFAVCAMVFVVAAVLAPPLHQTPAAKTSAP